MRALALSAALVAPFAARPARAQSLDRIERERVEQMLRVIKTDLKDNYYDPSYHGVDLDARFEVAETKLKAATSLGQAFGIVAQALLDLNDSHTFFLPPSRPGIVDYGWLMRAVGDDCYVAAVRPGSDAEAQGLKPGDRLLAVEGFKPNRKEMWKLHYYYYALSPRRGLRVTVQSPDGQNRQLDLAAKVREGNIMRDTLVYEEPPDPHRFYKDGRVSVWKMESFNLDEPQVDSKIDQVKAGGTMILDLRGNGGGWEVTLKRMVGNFFDHEVKIGDIKRRKEEKPLVAKSRGKDHFGGNLVVLIDSESGSAAELFARVMQLEKRAVVLGDRSMGAVMRSRRHVHEVGTTSVVFYGASITDADITMTDGKSIEHVGVTPDEILLPTGADMAAGRDPVLARAFEITGVKIDAAKAGAIFPFKWRK